MSPPRYSVVSAQALAGLDVFSTLSAAERERIVPLFLCRRFQANEPIIGQRTSEQAVYFIVSGEVRVKHFSARGRAVSFRDMAAGEMFGELAALEPTFIASLTSERFLTLLRDSPEVALSVMRRLTRLVRALSDRVVDFSTLAVRNRIHAEVLRLARQAGVENNRAEISKMPTHEEIAARVSTHREAVVRAQDVQGIQSDREAWSPPVRYIGRGAVGADCREGIGCGRLMFAPRSARAYSKMVERPRHCKARGGG